MHLAVREKARVPNLPFDVSISCKSSLPFRKAPPPGNCIPLLGAYLMISELERPTPSWLLWIT